MQDHAICDAIHRHRWVRIWYRGGYRLIEPYVFGVADGGHMRNDPAMTMIYCEL